MNLPIAKRALGGTALLALASMLFLPFDAELLARVALLGTFAAAAYGLALRRTRQPSNAERALEHELARIAQKEAAAVAKKNEATSQPDERHRVREAFIAAVSHELRTPLNAILGFTQILLDEIDGPLDSVQREDVTAIHDAGVHLKTLVEEVIDASARQSVEISPLERVELEPLVREIGRALEAQVRGRPLTLRIVLSDDLPAPIGDARRIRQILWNLGTNAVKYTARGEISISVRRDGSDVRFSVKDTGRGIAKTDLDRIFADHERVETEGQEVRGRKKSEGWGLGLAIAREMASFHGGRIEVESEVGAGSTFHFVMPIVGEAR